jgi:cellulose biosynthesis protein BcsQ
MARTATAAEHVNQSSTAAHFTLQGKGGVGKSFTSSILAQYFKSIGANTKPIDTDPVQQSLLAYKALNAEHIDLMNDAKINERNFDKLIERLLTEEGTFVIDNGSSSFIPLSNYLIENKAIQMLKDAGRQIYIHCVIAGGESLTDTLRGFSVLAQQTNEKNIVIWLNEYFGAIERDGKAFNEMKVYLEHADKVRGIVRIPKRNQDTFGQDIAALTAGKLTYQEAIDSANFSIMAKQRIKTVQRDIFEQLDEIGF